MRKILLLTKDDTLLLTMIDNELIHNDSIEVSANDEWIVIRLLKDYDSWWDIEVWIKDWEIVYKDK